MEERQGDLFGPLCYDAYQRHPSRSPSDVVDVYETPNFAGTQEDEGGGSLKEQSNIS